MLCPRCGGENPEDSASCSSCGAPHASAGSRGDVTDPQGRLRADLARRRRLLPLALMPLGALLAFANLPIFEGRGLSNSAPLWVADVLLVAMVPMAFWANRRFEPRILGFARAPGPRLTDARFPPFRRLTFAFDSGLVVQVEQGQYPPPYISFRVFLEPGGSILKPSAEEAAHWAQRLIEFRRIATAHRSEGAGP